jgi:hypothetical protein
MVIAWIWKRSYNDVASQCTCKIGVWLSSYSKHGLELSARWVRQVQEEQILDGF